MADCREWAEALEVRKDKLKDLVERGKNPFEITKFDVTNHSQEIKDFINNKYKGAVVPAF